MAGPFNTLLLDTQAYDLTVDAAGNIAMAGPPYALAQDAGSAIRTFKGECWFDTTIGVPYQLILGQSPNLQALKSAFVTAAMTVPGVSSAACFISSIVERRVAGQVQVTAAQTGQIAAAGFSSTLSPPRPPSTIFTLDESALDSPAVLG